MSREEAKGVAKELYRPLLPKLGCNRNFPILLRYNPSWLLGLGLYDPFLEQGLTKLLHFITHSGSSTISGNLFLTSLEHHQLEVGQFTSLFDLRYASHNFLTSKTWLTCLWEFVSEHDIKLSSSSPRRPQPLRQGDKAIMDIFLNDYNLPKKMLQSINRVRCHLKVFSIADIATGDGMKIRSIYSVGTASNRQSIWEWPKEQPSCNDVKAWKRAMQLLLDERNMLKFPVGKWLAKPHIHWQWFYSYTEDIVFQLKDGVYISYSKGRSATRTNPIFLKSNHQVQPSGPLSLTTVETISDNVICFEGTDRSDVAGLPLCVTTPCDSYWVLDNSNIHQSFNKEWVAQGLHSGTLTAVCDGSYKPNLYANGVTASFIIESYDQQSSILGTVATSGISADPYRAELLGIYTTLSAISFIERHNTFYTNGNIRIGCDNEMAGWVAGATSPTTSFKSKHIDLIKAIRALRSSLHTNTDFYHLYGHQDKHTPFDALPRDAQLNIIVDAEAQKAFDHAHENLAFKPNPRFFHEGWAVEIGGIKLNDKIAFHIRQWIAKRKLRHYLYQKDLIVWDIFPHLDFEPLRQYLSTQSQAFQLWFAKHWTGFCAIGSKMKQMKLWDNDLCPCFRRIPETKSMHIFLCPHPNMVKLRNKSFHNILAWLQETSTDPILIEIISTFWYGQELQLDSDTSPTIRTIYKILREIGVHQMWTGLLPNYLVDAQQQFYDSIGSRKSAKRWGTTLVGKMLRATHGLWMERNNILHLRTINGIHGLQLICLDRAVTRQYELGYENLNQEDHYLLEKEKQSLLQQPVEVIRGWLCEILIARGDFDAARLESLRDRGEITHCLPSLTPAEMRKYCDWRQVCLAQRFSTND